jgi:hypothetical protein
MNDSSGRTFAFIYIWDILSRLLDVNVNALSAVAAKQIENAQALR